MKTAISDLWAQMEGDIAAGKTSANWLLRLASPNERCPLFVAVDVASRRRALLLRLPSEPIPSQKKWPQCKGLSPLRLKIDGVESIGVAVRDERFNDVFAALAEDLLRRIEEASTPADRVRAFFGQLSRWHKFLTASLVGLADTEQRGLWGELRFLRECLLPVLGVTAITAWKGPEGAPQDFQFERGAIEVKTTLATLPQVVRISSERQLDNTTWPTLILHVIALDVRDSGGETLPTMVSSLRARLSADTRARDHFEDCLLLAGYLDAHAGRYLERGYLVRSETNLLVKKEFPMLAECNMPPGVGDVSYGLSVAACAAFSISTAALKKEVSKMNQDTTNRQRRGND